MFLFYIPFPTKELAHTIAKHVVAQGLARCANILAPCESIYMYADEGCNEKLCTDQESPVLFKVANSQRALFQEFIEIEHPYDTPAIICWPVTTNESFEKWVEKY